MDIDRRILVAARALTGLSQGEMAAEVGIHLNALSRIESGGAMRVSTFGKMTAAFGRLGVELISEAGGYSGVRRVAPGDADRSAGPFRGPRPRSRERKTAG